ncbi:MAG: CDGSH iron-sulfur domain-containing protein [Rhodospirillales bacterium]|jgi:CDGSH-type Zn-finger protein|nr:CDGSH iron-sulfur domain-containing protein [Rhodospirillales bacterium]MBT4006658.1 CDGSH iron-sulfur domain-containing protein [Rhodospirillales bacterium]MBT5076376.1 CDGSH iron-sulfur domain-containing protein [Rhodospirillales bacterium]MBT5113936.1 CDGSH iron-sulfur domain-containing protein [Rhodospirillales bacterium]MBT5672464.1 CDGSH iron-sulfur domain-containing protein [Rhodospirillales bacterium]
MAEPETPRKNYYQVDLEAGVEYQWCACGRSKAQPFCDGSHEGTEFQPKPVKVAESMRLYLCGCKRTTDAPYCDGSHVAL